MSKKEEDEQDGEYTDYLLLSSSDFSRGWKHNIMKLAPASASDATDPHSWTSAKLNRRDMRRVRYEEQQLARKAAEDAAAAEAGGGSGGAGEAAAGAGVGSGELKPGMPGFAVKQEIVKEERDESLVAPGLAGAAAVAGGNAPKAIARPKRGFGAPKKTRRVFMTDESQARRRVQFEEKHPWVLETTDDKKPPEATRWIGKMDAGASAQANGGEGSSYALFVLDTQAGSEAAFKVVPANRWYKFTSRPKYHVMTMEEAEEEYKSLSKAGDMDTWFSQRRALPASSAAGQSSTHSGAGRGARGPDSFMATGVANAASSYAARLAAARGREDDQVPRSRLKLVHADGAANDAASYGDEEPAGPSQRRAGKTAVKPRRRQELADDQYEEFEFEDDFQDDEEGIGQVGDAALDADDNKELEERIKREMRQANQVGEGIEDLDEDDGVGAKLTRAGKRVQKLLKKKGRKGRPEEEEDDVNEDDDDDDDDETRNPYASDEADGTDSEAEREEARARQSQNKQATIAAASMARPTGPNMPGSLSRNGSGAPGGANAPKYPGAPGPSANPSRANSAGPSTSGPGSRATSPQPGTAPQKRAGTPSGRVKQSGSRAASPTPPPSATKRKAEEGNSPNADASAAGTGGGGKKRRKPGSPSPPPPAPVPVAAGDDSALIPRADIIAFIGSNAPTTKELLRHFKVAMARDPRNRDVILQVTKEVASINAGKLTLKPDVA